MASSVNLAAASDDCGIVPNVTFLNSARRSPMARQAHEAMLDAIWRDFRGELRDDDRLLLDAKLEIAQLIGASYEEISLTQSASDSFNRVLNALDWRKGDNVVVTDISYRTIAMALLRLREEHEVSVRFAATSDWRVEPEAICHLVDERTKLVVVDHVPVFCGVIQPVEAIGKALRGSGALFLVNATQSAGQLPIDVHQIECAFLIGTSRKWIRGPRGLGFVFVRRELIDFLRPPAIGYPAAFWATAESYECVHTIDRLRVGDQPYQLLAGLAAALRYARALGMEEISCRNAELWALAREALRTVGSVTLYDAELGTTGTVPFNLRHLSADEAVAALEASGVRVCAIHAENARSAFARINSDGLIRASFHYFNGEKDIAILRNAIEQICSSEATSRSFA